VDYGEIVAAAREALARLRGGSRAQARRPGGGGEEESESRLRRLRKRLQEVAAIDFFAAPERAQAEAAIQALELRLHPPAAADERGHSHAELVGKTWVTRKGVFVDRIATAWLVRRFLDPAARFRFVDARETAASAGEVRFDMVGGDITHEGDDCTFETLAKRLRVREAALRAVGEIVHDIDLKDGKFGRAEAAGVEQLVAGVCRADASDEERCERGFQLFDDLYRSFTAPRAATPESRATKAVRRGAKR
jgi:hypothetical protein